MISIKAGVKLCDRFGTPISPVWGVALPIISACYSAALSDCVITSGYDGKHKQGSLHYVGKALDFRTWNVAPEHRADLAVDLRSALGPDFDVVLESDHIHIEFDPKGGL